MSCIYTLTLNPSMDLFVTTESVVPDVKLRGSELIKHPGGGGINASRVIHRLGGNTKALFPVGGFPGNELLHLLEKEKVPVIAVDAQFEVRESFSAFEESTGRIFRFVPQGSKLPEAALMKILVQLNESLNAGDYLFMSGSLPEGVGKEFLTALKDVIRKKDAIFVVDTSTTTLLWAVDAGVDILRVNHHEAKYIKDNLPGLSDVSDKELADFLLTKKGIKTFICTRGDEGAWWFEKGFHLKASPPKVKVLSSVGAGDSFMGGLLYGLCMKIHKSEALAYAVASATATVMSPGTELCQRDDVLRIKRDVKTMQGET